MTINFPKLKKETRHPNPGMPESTKENESKESHADTHYN